MQRTTSGLIKFLFIAHSELVQSVEISSLFKKNNKSIRFHANDQQWWKKKKNQKYISYLWLVSTHQTKGYIPYTQICYPTSFKNGYWNNLHNFAQSLWIKAMDTAAFNKVLRLGVFHMLMSNLGNIGEFMVGYSLEVVLNKLYGDSAVPHIMSGNVISCSLRGHFLVIAGLMNMLFRYFCWQYEPTAHKWCWRIVT